MASTDFKRYICVKFQGYCYTNNGLKPIGHVDQVFVPSENWIDSNNKLKGGFHFELYEFIWKFNSDWFANLIGTDIDFDNSTTEIPGDVYAKIWNAIEGIIQLGIVNLGYVTPIGCNLKAVYDEDSDTVTFEGNGNPCGLFVNHLLNVTRDHITTFEIYTEQNTYNQLWPDEGE